MSNRSNGSFGSRLEAAWLRRGTLAIALWPLSLVFRVLVAVRRSLYATGLLRSERLDVPVLVVGNLVAGGAGKTPTVLATLKTLRRLGYSPGVVSRGYRPGRPQRPREEPMPVTATSLASVVGDEPLLLRLRGGVPVVIGRDRVAAGRELRRLHPEVDVIVSDDGLQHLRLARDTAVMVFDERGAGNGWLLPAGPLREPVPRCVAATTVVLYNASKPSTALAGWLARPSLAGASSLDEWWAGMAPDMDTLASLRHRSMLAAAAIARPERFFSMLEAHGLEIRRMPLPDHFDYGATALPWPSDTRDIVVTEKDAAKLRPGTVGHARVWVVALDFEPEEGFHMALAALFPDKSRTRAAATGSLA